MNAAATLRHDPPISREKRAERLRAIAALAGWCAWPTVDDHGRDGWILSRDHVTRELPSIDAAESFLDEMGQAAMRRVEGWRA